MKIKALPGTAIIQFSIVSLDGYGGQQTAQMKFDSLSEATKTALANDIENEVAKVPTTPEEEDKPTEA